jgi:hypothetical protein
VNIPKKSRARHLEVARSLFKGHSIGAVSRRFNIPTDRCFGMLKAISIEAMNRSGGITWDISGATRLNQILKLETTLTPQLDKLEIFWRSQDE